MAKRFESIQVLRGVAALLVVLLHATNVASDAAGPTGDAGALAALVGPSQAGAMGVDLFFVISGFVMAHATAGLFGMADARRFLAARFLRVVPPFWLAASLQAVLLAALGLPLTRLGCLNALTVLPLFDSGPDYTLPPLTVGWTLTFEAVFYVLVAILISLVPPQRRSRWLLLSVAGLGSLGIAGRGGFLLNPILLEFAGGILVHRLWATGRRRSALTLGRASCVVLLATALWTPGFDTYPWLVLGNWVSLRRALTWGLPMAGLVYAAVATPWPGGPVREGLRHVGAASYSLYLVHMPVMTALTAWGRAHPGVLPGDVLSLGAIAIALPLGLLGYQYLERPWCRWSRARLPGPQSASGSRLAPA